MKKIILMILVLISINAISQTPPGYQYRTVREKLLAFMVDSGLHIPRYNGVPSGLRNGVAIQDGLIASDTLNGRVYHYWNGAWRGMVNLSELSSYMLYSDSLAMLSPYLRGATAGFGQLITGGQHKTWGADTTSGGVSSWLHVKKEIDSLAAAGWGTGTTYTANLPIRITGTVISADTSVAFAPSLTTNARLLKLRDSIYASPPSPGIDNVLAINQSLTATRTIDVGSNDLIVDRSGAFTTTFGSSGGGLKAISNGNVGVYGISQDDVAGVVGENSSVLTGSIQSLKNISNTHLSTPAIDIFRLTSGSAQNGIGSKIKFMTETSTGVYDSTNMIESYWSTVTHASRESRMRIWGVNNTVQEKFFEIQPDYLIFNNGTDTVASKADVRAGGGGGSGVTAADLPLRVTGSTVSADTSVAYNPSLTTNQRTQKIIDSLQAAGWGAQSVNYEPWYKYYIGSTAPSITEYIQKASAGTGSSAGSITASNIPNGWMFGFKNSTGTTSSGSCYYYAHAGGGYAPVSISSSFRYNWGAKLRLEDLSDGTETYELYGGFQDGDYPRSSQIVDGVYFRYAHTDSSGKWIACTESNNTLTEMATSTTVAADTDYTLEISVIGGSAYFYINKVLAATISTNVPSGSTRATGIGLVFLKSAGTTNRDMYMEWMGFGQRLN